MPDTYNYFKNDTYDGLFMCHLCGYGFVNLILPLVVDIDLFYFIQTKQWNDQHTDIVISRVLLLVWLIKINTADYSQRFSRAAASTFGTAMIFKVDEDKHFAFELMINDVSMVKKI